MRRPGQRPRRAHSVCKVHVHGRARRSAGYYLKTAWLPADAAGRATGLGLPWWDTWRAPSGLGIGPEAAAPLLRMGPRLGAWGPKGDWSRWGAGRGALRAAQGAQRPGPTAPSVRTELVLRWSKAKAVQKVDRMNTTARNGPALQRSTADEMDYLILESAAFTLGALHGLAQSVFGRPCSDKKSTHLPVPRSPSPSWDTESWESESYASDELVELEVGDNIETARPALRRWARATKPVDQCCGEVAKAVDASSLLAVKHSHALFKRWSALSASGKSLASKTRPGLLLLRRWAGAAQALKTRCDELDLAERELQAGNVASCYRRASRRAERETRRLQARALCILAKVFVCRSAHAPTTRQKAALKRQAIDHAKSALRACGQTAEAHVILAFYLVEAGDLVRASEHVNTAYATSQQTGDARTGHEAQILASKIRAMLGDADDDAGSYEGFEGFGGSRAHLADDAAALAVLGLQPNSSWQEVRKAYRSLVLIHHPDKRGDTHAFHDVQQAYEQLEGGRRGR